MKSNWFRIQASGNVVEIDIYDEIGMWGVYAIDFKREIDAVALSGREIIVDINSPGGDVFEGIAIYHAIAKYRDRVTVTVSGVAASIASIIALAGNSLTMKQGSFLMIHNPWTIAMGTAEDLRNRAKTLDQIRDEMVGIYESSCDLSRDEIVAAMDAETWYSPDDAYQAGFAAAIQDDEIAASMAFNWRQFGYSRVPQPLWEARRRSVAPRTERQFEESLVALGFSNREAERIVRDGYRSLQGDPADSAGQGEPDYAASLRELNKLMEGESSNE